MLHTLILTFLTKLGGGPRQVDRLGEPRGLRDRVSNVYN